MQELVQVPFSPVDRDILVSNEDFGYLEALVIYLPYCVVDKPKQSSSTPLDPYPTPLGPPMGGMPHPMPKFLGAAL